MRAAPGPNGRLIRRRVVSAYVVLQLGMSLALALVGLWSASHATTILVDSELQAAAGGVAALAIFWHAGTYAQTRRAWRWAGGAAGLWCAGQVWLTGQLAITGQMGRPSPADALFGLAVVCAVIAATAFPSLPRGSRGRLRLWVDGSVLAGSVLFLFLHRIGDLIDRGDQPWQLAYPLADCLVVTLLLTAAMRSPRRLIPSLGTAVMGLVVLSVTNLETFRLTLEDRSTLATPLNAGFAIGLALTGLGALLQSDPSELPDAARKEELAQRSQRLLPYALVPVVLVAVLMSDGAPQGLQLALLVFLATLLLLRQLLVVEENAALAYDVVRRARGYEALVQGSSELVMVIDPLGHLSYASPSVEKALGWDREEGLLDLVSGDDRRPLEAAIEVALVDGRSACTFRVNGVMGPIVLEARLTDRIADPAVEGIVVNARDVTVQALAQARLADSEQRYRRIVETAQEGIWVTDAAGITRFINARAAAMLQLPVASLLGKPAAEVLAPLLDDAGRAEIAQRMEARRTGEIASYEFGLTRPDGTWIHTQITASPLFDPEGRYDGSLTMVTDITARLVAEEQLRKDARTDPLTGLANRAFLSREAALALADYDPARPPALVYCDLDGFKTVNDAWGHSAGDELLRKVALRLKELEGPDITIGRLGGDEFAVLIADTPDDEVDAFTERLMAALREPYALGEREHHIDLSVGIAIAQPGDQVESMLRNADLAMYQAKSDGRGRYRRYAPAMHEVVAARIELEHDLRHAVDRNELRLHYQPILALDTGECVGAEALIRWQHPTMGLIPPDVFLPTAEVSDLILKIGSWVLERAMTDAMLWPVAGQGPVVSVNIAPQQLMDARHVGDLARILTTTALPATQVILEVTERSLLAGEGPREGLRTLRRTGARLALDDFGTGYSSIAHLRDHPVDVLKLDRSYVSHVTHPTPSGRLAMAILEMSRQLGISCTAEGIETPDQAAALAAAGCAHAQGFLFARPMPQEELLRWMAGSGSVPDPRHPFDEVSAG
ncbi:MAG: hypothetical protein JWM40_1897 [Frankiales bacterium]|nr:hypothetical protein [Frankiales bacterium]